MTVSTSRLANRHELRHPLRACVAAMPKRDLAKDDQRPQSTLRQIVRRRNSRVVQEDEPLAAMSQQPCLQRDGLLMTDLARFESR